MAHGQSFAAQRVDQRLGDCLFVFDEEYFCGAH